MDSATKVCTKCGERKAITMFGAATKGRGGRKSACKVCTNAAVAMWHRKNAELVNDRKRRARANREGADLPLRRAAYAKDPDKFRARTASWRASNPDKAKQSVSRWRSENPDKDKESQKKAVAELSDAYVACAMRMPVGAIPVELIKLKRVQLQITRLLKEKSK